MLHVKSKFPNAIVFFLFLFFFVKWLCIGITGHFFNRCFQRSRQSKGQGWTQIDPVLLRMDTATDAWLKWHILLCIPCILFLHFWWEMRMTRWTKKELLTWQPLLKTLVLLFCWFVLKHTFPQEYKVLLCVQFPYVGYAVCGKGLSFSVVFSGFLCRV